MGVFKEQLKRFRVDIEYYITEQSLYDKYLIETILKEYRKHNAIYEKDGAVWLKTTEFGDDKDCVLVKSDLCDVNKLSTRLQADLVFCFEKCLEGDEATSLLNISGRNVLS
jgi:arginyl-tRNA synthetase